MTEEFEISRSRSVSEISSHDEEHSTVDETSNNIERSKSLSLITNDVNDSSSAAISVYVRFRPLMGKEKESIYMDLSNENRTLTISDNENEPNKKKPFRFDRIFDFTTSQNELYEMTLKNNIDYFFKGYNLSLLCYGGTGSGKSHTICGSSEYPGLIPRFLMDVFKRKQEIEVDIEVNFTVSYIEIYTEHFHDLLDISNKEISIHEKINPKTRVAINFYELSGATEMPVNSLQETFELYFKGNDNRSIAHTERNLQSSRSHSIFILKMEQFHKTEKVKYYSLAYLVDLAGSEQVKKSKVIGQGLNEAKYINKSLSNLAHVIESIVKGRQHIPYRDSNLTKLLKHSLGWNSRTAIILNCSPEKSVFYETYMTLLFGRSAKNIKNIVAVNKEFTVEAAKAKIAALEHELKNAQEYSEELQDRYNQFLEEQKKWKTEREQDEKAQNFALELEKIQDELSQKQKEHSRYLRISMELKESEKQELEILSKYQEDIAAKDEMIAKLKEDEKLELEKINKYQEDIAAKDEMIAKLKEDEKLKLEKINKYQEEIVTRDEMIAKLKEDEKLELEKINKYNEDIVTMNEKITELTNAYNNLLKIVEQHKDTLEMKNCEIESLYKIRNEILEKYQNEMNIKEQEKQELLSHYNMKINVIQSQNAELNEKSQQIDQVKQQQLELIQKYNEDLEHKEEQIRQLTERHQQLSQDLLSSEEQKKFELESLMREKSEIIQHYEKILCEKDEMYKRLQTQEYELTKSYEKEIIQKLYQLNLQEISDTMDIVLTNNYPQIDDHDLFVIEKV